MAPTEKDRLGEKLREVERGREDQYFAERDRKLIEERRRLREHAVSSEVEAEIRQAALMRCPKCGQKLVQRRLHGVTVDSCPACQGMWLGKGELEAIAHRENEGWIARWLRYEFDEAK
jgi:ribosomal protein L37AE/L43A